MLLLEFFYDLLKNASRTRIACLSESRIACLSVWGAENAGEEISGVNDNIESEQM